MSIMLPSGARTVLTTLAQLAGIANDIANENEERYQERLAPAVGAQGATAACWRDACEQVAIEVYPYGSADWDAQARVDVLRGGPGGGADVPRRVLPLRIALL